MSISSDKKNIASSLSVITTLSSSLNSPATNNNLDSNVNVFNNDSKDPIDFMLSLFSVLIGVEVLKGLTKELLNKSLPDIDKQIKNTLKNNILNNDDSKAMDMNFSLNGYDLKVSEIDYEKKLKSTPENDLVMENGSMDNAIMNAINNVGSVQTYNNMNIVYDNTTDNINIKPNKPNQKTNEFLIELIDSLTFVNKNLLITLIVDFIFGTLRKSKSRNQVYNDELYNSAINNIIKDEDNDNYFEINANELTNISNNTNNVLNGLLPLDFDCGIVESNFSIYSLQNLIDSNDPIDYFDNELDNILPSDPKDGNRDDLSSNQLNTVNNKIQGNNKYNNKSATKNKVYKGFINGLIVVLTKKTTMSPQGLVILTLSKKLSGDNSPIGTGLDLVKNNKNIIKCITKSIKSEMTAFLYKKLKKEVIKAVKGFTLAVINEKINSYYGILKSLTNI